jgi:flavin reductase (DIM6/NTAB) family NADH-FMN oxidoreductase RutF
MQWEESDAFEPGSHGNKPFAIRIPSLLVSRGSRGPANFLTAMWFTPAGFEPSRTVIAISKSTYTYNLVNETREFVLSAPTARMMDVVVFAGRTSGRDMDKFKETGLTPVRPSKISVPLIGEAIGNVEYKVVNQFPLDDAIDLFVGEVMCVHVRKGVMEGDLYREDSDPLLYMGTKYNGNGESLGKYSAKLSGIEVVDYESPLLKKHLLRK